MGTPSAGVGSVGDGGVKARYLSGARSRTNRGRGLWSCQSLGMVGDVVVRCLAGGPRGEQVERMRGGGGRFGGVEGERESGFGDHVNTFVGQLEIADDLVVKEFSPGAVVADIVGTPSAAEILTAGGQFADQVVQQVVVGVAAGFGSEYCDAGVGGLIPVGVEAVGVVVEEGVAGEVRVAAGSLSYSEECMPRPRWLTASRSIRPLRTIAGAVNLSRTHCRLGRGVQRFAGRRRGRMPALVPSAAWARWNRWARSASSSCRARAIASRTEAETPARAPRSSLL